MRFYILTIFILLSGLKLTAQELVCNKVSKEVFNKKRQQLFTQEVAESTISARLITIANSFLGTEYVAKTLDTNVNTENLIIELKGVDCTTFLEYVSALNYIIQKNDTSFIGFTAALKKFRYRDGELDGYVSRLHYFSEWLQDNQKKGLLRIMSKSLGGMPINKEINFMSMHAKSYPQLIFSAEKKRQIANIEKNISPQNIHFIPQNEIKGKESGINNGDIIALTTSISGLDVVHVGFAVKKNERIHLLHASTSGMKVKISEKPLSEMVIGNKIQNGIIVARLEP